MIIDYSKNYQEDYIRLVKLLWKDIEDKDIQVLITPHEQQKEKVFLYLKEDKVVGFINISVRNDYVEGCDSTGVGYIEGIYVCESYRRNQIAVHLIEHAIAFFKELGFTEIGSDTELSNEVSQFFHKAIGFKEVNKLVHYVMKIDD